MEDGNDANFRWVLERQKSDYTEIKKQARRYILGATSIVVILVGVWYRNDVSFKSKEELTTSLVEGGLIWQMGLLPSNYAYAFVESFSSVSAVFTGIGSAVFFISFSLAYKIEQVPGCQPTGNAKGLIDEDYKKVREWIDHNDKLIEKVEEARYYAMEFAKIGIILILLGAILYYLIYIAAILYFPLLFYAILYTFHKFHSVDPLKESKLRKAMGVVLIVVVLTRPIHFLQELTNYALSEEVLAITSLLILLFSLTYVRHDIYSQIRKCQEYLFYIVDETDEYIQRYRR